jgi:photosystem II stability/assembly factor-like uncharacterized protein
MRFLVLSIICVTLMHLPVSGQLLEPEQWKAFKPRNIGPAGMSGRVTAIDVVLRKPEIIYAGTASGGLWKSESGGIDWKPIFDKEKAASIGALAIDQRNPDVIWVGTGEGNPRNSQTSGFGVYRSLDGGENWQHMGLEKTRNIHRILVDPHHPNTVYVGAQGSAWGKSADRGVYKTTDGGRTWEKILYVNDETGVADLVMDPNNPNKLIAALWQFGRKPWIFNSGGPGSGIYHSWDGGRNWQQVKPEDGLPTGNLGRIGLAIAPSNSRIVYALVEAEKNALYRSVDGGRKWNKIADKNIGDRPFYYSELYVDPKNENRIYNLYTFVSVSEDGGRTFSGLMTWAGRPTDVHPDHHAWWIHPENPDFMINGNDGGLNITRDRGRTWFFAPNLPLAQFYHINVDNDRPYNVYGGMQDNGSWRGPGYVWRSGGIRNEYWEEVNFGDGFDVMPHPDDSRIGYAMSQGGRLVRYDLSRGSRTLIQPVHPEGLKLRFNWNAGLAQDPFDANTIYYGSQFLHKSSDRGDHWTIISPDLTTNDPEKQQQSKSGGLTLDVTAAENNTTIIAIAPSPVQQGVIWVGTDDGNIQVTTDGGKSWSNVAGNIKGLPKNSWVTQVRASTYSASEAFAVIDNHRIDDWNVYVYHTRDYGKTWKPVAGDDQVWGYALAFVQDPVEPKLYFLGTEFGLYISTDAGAGWTKWTEGYPTVSTMDLTIQPVEHDLVAGTFGRAAFVFDDIRPLRTLAREGKNLLEAPLRAFEAPEAVLANWQQAAGVRFAAHAAFIGDNRNAGAMLSFWMKEIKQDSAAIKSGLPKKTDSLSVTVRDTRGLLVRNYKSACEAGFNRIYWNLSRNGVRGAGTPEKKDAPPPSGFQVLPGEYWVRLSYGDHSDSALVRVISDPRERFDAAAVQQKEALIERHYANLRATTTAMDRLREIKKNLGLIKGQIDFLAADSLKSLGALADSLGREADSLMYRVIAPPDMKGIWDDSHLLTDKQNTAAYYLYSLEGAPTDAHRLVIGRYEADQKTFMDDLNEYLEKRWNPFAGRARSSLPPAVKTYVPLE